MHNGETPAPEEHPAKKLMHYPIDSDSDGIPASVIRNPELARILGDNEDTYRDNSPKPLDEDEHYSALEKSARAAQNLMGEYYRSHNTTKQAVKKAIQHDNPAWLDPKYPQVLAAERWQEKQERQYQESVKTLATMRFRVRESDTHSDISLLDKNSGPMRSGIDKPELDYLLFSPYVEQTAILRQITYGAQLEGYHSVRHFEYRILGKVKASERALFAASSLQYEEFKVGQTPKAASKIAFEALALDVSSLRQKINSAVRDNQLNPEASLKVFDTFDLAKYSAADFDRIRGNIDAEGSNVEALLRELYETDPETIEESQKIQELEFAFRDEAREKAKQRRLQTQARYETERTNRMIDRAEQRAREKVAMDEFLRENPQLVEGKEPFKQKVAQQHPEVAEAISYLDVTKEYRAEFDSIDSLGAAMTAFTINASEQIETTPGIAVTLPLGKTDVGALWRNKFDRPKNYFGGQAGRGKIAIRPAQEDDVKGYKTKYDLELEDSLFAVEMTIEGIKNGKVQIESTLHGVLHPVAHAKLPIERYVFIPLKSTYEANQEQLDREQYGSIQVARAAEAASMMRPVSGTISPAQRRR